MQGVEQFLRYVIEPNGLALGMGFHPDNDFAKYTFIDLFAGCGGLSEGFYRQGFKALAHIEKKKYF